MKNTKTPSIIFGAAGHAKSVISIIEAEAKWQIHGLLIDSEYRTRESSLMGYNIIGDRAHLFHLQQASINTGFVAIGDNLIRAKITADFLSRGMSLAVIIHPSAIIMTNTIIGSGTMIHAQAVLGTDSSVGSHAIISATSVVGHDSQIGNYAHLTPGVLIGGGATIGDYSFLGLGAAVLPNVNIGKNVQIGANSVIHKDLPDNVIAAGNPARVIKRNQPI